MSNFGSLLLVVCFSCTGFAQSDADKFTEGRVALDKYHDCKAAKQALESVSAQGRNNALWVLYMAKADECLGLKAEALQKYEQYNRLVPGQAEIIDKIGDLRYQVSKIERATAFQRLGAQAAPALTRLAEAINTSSDGGQAGQASVSRDAPCHLELAPHVFNGTVVFVNSGGGITFGTDLQVRPFYQGLFIALKGSGVSALRWGVQTMNDGGDWFDPGLTEFIGTKKMVNDLMLGNFKNAQVLDNIVSLINEVNRLCTVN